MNSIPLEEAAVLIVEDNADNLLIIQELLRRNRARYINGRASGRQLIKLIEANPDRMIHLILLDLQIPHEDGYAILKRVRELPELAQTRVAAVTANIMPSDVARAREAGFDGFIGKPLNPERFGEQIRRLLAGEEVWEPR